MKKKLKTLLSIVLPTAVCAGAIFAFSAVAANKYDVTGDGRVNSHDLVNMMKYLSGEIKYDPDTTESDKVTDVTKDPDTTENPEVPKDTDKPIIPDDPKDTDNPMIPDDPKDTDKPVIPEDPKDTDTTPNEPDVPAAIKEKIPGEDMPFEVFFTASANESDIDKNFVFDDASEAFTYLDEILRYSFNIGLEEKLQLVSEVNTEEKRIVVLAVPHTSLADSTDRLTQLAKLSLNDGKLGVLYAINDAPDIVQDCLDVSLITVVTVDRETAEALSANPDVELYMYRTTSGVLKKY